jgi:hypothetical protein
LKLIEETELNALVIDVKGDRGMIPYRSSIPLAAEIGAQKIITVRDVEEQVHTREALEHELARQEEVLRAGGEVVQDGLTLTAVENYLKAGAA